MDYEEMTIRDLAQEFEGMYAFFTADGIARAMKKAFSPAVIALIIERLQV